MIRLFFLVVMFCSISACVVSKRYSVPDVNVSSSEQPVRIKYTGKGAGAGVMLMGAMGPMGIAVGIAIDEGIGKDINQAFVDQGFDHLSVFKNAFKGALLRVCSNDLDRLALCIHNDEIEVRITSLALKAAPGDSDRVISNVSFDVMYGDVAQSLNSSKNTLCTSELSDDLGVTKTNGTATKDLLSACIDAMVLDLSKQVN